MRLKELEKLNGLPINSLRQGIVDHWLENKDETVEDDLANQIIKEKNYATTKLLIYAIYGIKGLKEYIIQRKR